MNSLVIKGKSVNITGWQLTVMGQDCILNLHFKSEEIQYILHARKEGSGYSGIILTSYNKQFKHTDIPITNQVVSFNPGYVYLKGDVDGYLYT